MLLESLLALRFALFLLWLLRLLLLLPVLLLSFLPKAFCTFAEHAPLAVVAAQGQFVLLVVSADSSFGRALSVQA